ncbi:MAG: hypothetical protein NC307_01895 [Roseburia sp.]|nr:hypothetical protein [Roseburia sp.]
MLAGVYQAKKKNGSIYYRSSITFLNKHISLGSFETESEAHAAYLKADEILKDKSLLLEHLLYDSKTLGFEKIVSLANFRDNNIYIKTPIYLHANYFSYYLSPGEEYKFDIDDLFFYSSHKIMKRGGHLFVNEYGMQTNLLSRYGIKNFAVSGRDYDFANGDKYDYRYSNIIVINQYYGVAAVTKQGNVCYEAHIHINGNYKIGTYETETLAAVAYNKAVDYALSHGIKKNFPENYITELSAKEYADIYSSLKISRKYLNYLSTNFQGQ